MNYPLGIKERLEAELEDVKKNLSYEITTANMSSTKYYRTVSHSVAVNRLNMKIWALEAQLNSLKPLPQL